MGAARAPYVLVSALLTVLYIAIPNTRVRLRPALIGGVAAGMVWAAVGRYFSEFVLYSARLTLVYAGFAIMIAALLWTYFGWTILLLGARLSFYAQNPGYLREGLSEPRLSGADIERLALGIMYLIAERARDHRPPWGVSELAMRLEYPDVALARICRGLAAAGYLAAAAMARCNWRATRGRFARSKWCSARACRAAANVRLAEHARAGRSVLRAARSHPGAAVCFHDAARTHRGTALRPQEPALRRQALRYSPAMVMASISTEPVRMAPWVSTSVPTARMPRNMSRRLLAIVTSCTGNAIAPPSTQKPLAPRE